MSKAKGSAMEPFVASPTGRTVLATVASGRWSLERARAAAEVVASSPRAATALVQMLFSEDAERRKRAADVARRMTELMLRRDRASRPLAGCDLLRRRAEELLGLLASLPPAESRTRWHLGLVVARVVHTREQRLRAARLMEMLALDESVVVRCSGIEGLGLLALAEPGLRPRVEEISAHARVSGNAAERCRARDALQRLERQAKRPQAARTVRKA